MLHQSTVTPENYEALEVEAPFDSVPKPRHQRVESDQELKYVVRTGFNERDARVVFAETFEIDQYGNLRFFIRQTEVGSYKSGEWFNVRLTRY